MYDNLSTKKSMEENSVHSHAPITPTFPFGSNCKIVGDDVEDDVEELDVGPPLLTLLQP